MTLFGLAMGGMSPTSTRTGWRTILLLILLGVQGLAALLMFAHRSRVGAWVALGLAGFLTLMGLPRPSIMLELVLPLALAAWLAWPTFRPAEPIAGAPAA